MQYNGDSKSSKIPETVTLNVASEWPHSRAKISQLVIVFPGIFLLAGPKSNRKSCRAKTHPETFIKGITKTLFIPSLRERERSLLELLIKS